jgi:hypothetical protein
LAFVWPEPNSSAAGENSVDFIVSKTRITITFASPAQDSDFMADLSLYKVKETIALNSSSFDVL